MPLAPTPPTTPPDPAGGKLGLMSSPFAPNRRVPPHARAAALFVVPAIAAYAAPIMLAHPARAQEATAGAPSAAAPSAAAPPSATAPPVGLPPAAVILNSPIGGMPNTLGLGDLNHAPAVPPAGGPGVPAWTIVPAISAQEMYNSNIFQSQSSPKGDFVTGITPSIQITGDTPRITANLQYAPTFQVYANERSADSVAQQGIGSVTATLVPDTLFVTARALATIAPSGGGLGGLSGFGGLSASSTAPIAGGLGSSAAPGALVLNRNNRSQNFAASITPYAVHRFGDFGTVKAGLTVTESYLSTNVLNPVPGTVSTGTQTSTTGEATAQFLGGSDFGRLREFALADGSRSSGTGVLSGAHTAIITNWLGYALNRVFTPFVEFGAESLHYNTAPVTNINDGVWQVGVVLSPNVDSQILVGYGHRDGFNAANVNGYYQVTARTRLTVSYTTALQTDLQQIVSTLGLTSFDQFGNPVDVQTGAPLFLGTGLLSSQNALFRTHTLNFSSITVLDRDTVTTSVQHQNQEPVGNAAGAQPGVGESATTFSVAWTHQLSQRTTLGVGGGYTMTTFQTTPSGTEHFVNATAGVSYLITPTVSTVARYAFFDRSSQFAGRSFTENVFLVGVTKRF